MGIKFSKFISSIIMSLVFFCTITGYGEANPNKTPELKIVKPNQLEDYTEIFAANLAFKIPSYLTKGIEYRIYLYPDNQHTVQMWEGIFSNSANGAAEFKSRYDKALTYPRTRFDDPVVDNITDQISYPSFLITNVCGDMVSNILEDIPDEDKKLKMHLPSTLDAYLKLAHG